MRPLNGTDLMLSVRTIQKSGLKDKLKPALAMAASNGADVTNVGVETIMTAVFTLAESEKAVWEVLAGPFEMSPEEVATLPLEPLCDGIEYLCRDGGLLAFFKRLSGLIGAN